MAWFDDIAPGDQVLVLDGRGRTAATVERVTATQFVADGVRFTKYGKKVGCDRRWAQTRAIRATPELLQQVASEQRYTEALEQLRTLATRLDTAWRVHSSSADHLERTIEVRTACIHLQRAIAAITPAAPTASQTHEHRSTTAV